MLEWRESYELGIKKIDDEHRKLFSIMEGLELDGCISCDNNKQELLGKLLNYVMKHFQTEERHFLLYKYPDKDEHIKEHRIFIDKINEINKKIVARQEINCEELLRFLEDWWVAHIMDTDKKYVECFKEHGF